GISAGNSRVAVEPVPSWPRSFAPQHRTRPSERRTHACSEPATIWTASLTPGTAIGVALELGLDTPSWPSAFDPQHDTLPLWCSTQRKLCPCAICQASVIPGTSVGAAPALVWNATWPEAS